MVFNQARVVRGSHGRFFGHQEISCYFWR